MSRPGLDIGTTGCKATVDNRRDELLNYLRQMGGFASSKSRG
jgi:hypothetical protein